jgi:stage V sporulation protein B
MKLDTRSASYGTVLLTAIHLASQIIAFFYRVALVRLVGGEIMGLYQLVVPVYSVIMAIAATGLTVAVSKLSATYAAVNHSKRLPQLVSAALRCFFVLFAGIAVVTVLFSDAISVQLLGDARTRLGLLVLLPCIFFTGIENVHKNYFYGMKNVHPPAVSELAEQLVRSAAILLLVSLFPDTDAERRVALMVAGLVICEVVSAWVLRVWYKHDIKHRCLSGNPIERRALYRSMRTIAVPVSLSALALTVIGSANAIIIPQRLTVSGLPASEALSVYGVVFGMVLPLIALPMACVSAMSLVLSPRLSEAAAVGDLGRITRAVKRAVRATTLIMVPVLTLLSVAGRPLVDWLYRSDIGSGAMALLCLSFLFAAYQSVAGGVLNAVGLQRKAAANFICSGAVQLIITWFAVAHPDLRLLGVILAMCVSSLMGMTLNLIDVRRYLRSVI